MNLLIIVYGLHCVITPSVDDVKVRSTPLSRPNKVGLKCLSIRPSVRPSTKSLFDFNEIWYVGRGSMSNA